MRHVGQSTAELLVLSAVFSLTRCAPPGPGEPATFDVNIHHVPTVVYAATQGSYMAVADNPNGAHAETQKLTWLFHLVFESRASGPLRVEGVDTVW